MSELLKNLNEEQKAAVTHVHGPLMIVAGAGTGKTTVVTHRIAWLIEQEHVKPEEILALTFTDKAAGEMEERVDLLLPYGYVDLQISTFHAFCERLLREYGAEIGLSRDFKMADELDAWLLARQNFESFELDTYRPLGNPTRYLRSLLTHFSRAKDMGVTADDYVKAVESGMCHPEPAEGSSLEEQEAEQDRLKELAGAYKTYQDILLENDSLDFGDLLLFVLKLLKERPHVLKKIRAQYKQVMVDEFQDTNKAQYDIVKLIAAPKNNLTVVGDDDQSIYKFRGASLENILQFEHDYPKAKHVVLTHNYRSLQPILDVAHGFIQNNNPHRLEATNERLCKQLVSQKEGEALVEHVHCRTLDEEARFVVERILELKDAHPDASWNDFGILVRSNNAAPPFLAMLERRGVPYQFLAMRGLYSKAIILDLLAYMRVVANPYESPSLYRLLAHPMFAIPASDLVELTHEANRQGKALVDICRQVRGLEVRKETADEVEELLRQLYAHREQSLKRKTSELFVMIVRELGLVKYINTLTEQEKADGFAYLQQFLERIKRFEGRHDHPVLKHFLEEFQFERDAGEEGSLIADMEAGPEMVRVMTVHASKGLEFRYVFVVNLIDGRFPTHRRGEAIPLPDGLDPQIRRSADSKETEERSDGEVHLAEERRLFYVAVTRAKEGIYFTSAEDYGGARKRKASRFLREAGFDPKEKGVVQNSLAFDALPDQPDLEDDPDTVIIHLPKRFSFTQLTAFRTCPMQYKFAHVLKVPVFGKWSLSFGKTMHNTLHQFFIRWMEEGGSEKPMRISSKELMKLYEENWIDEWYIDDTHREKYRDQGEESLKGYYAYLKKNPPKPLYLEQGFTLKVGEIVLKGRIDRMDAFEDGVEIVDYKTGTPKTQKTLRKEDKEQLYLYQMAAQDVLGLKPKKLTYHYLQDNSQVSFLGSEKDLQKIRDSIGERVDQIRSSTFLPNPGFHCGYCDFNDICEFRES